MSQIEWYSAKTVFKHDLKGDKEAAHFEERVVVLQASSFDNAIIEGEKEASEYANNLEGVTYLGFINIFKLFSGTLENKTEVYSLMRKSNLDAEAYLDTFHDTGTECTK